MIVSGLVHPSLEELQGQTLLDVAKVPQLTTLTSRGVVGRVRTIPDGLEPTIEVGTLALLGYDPATCYTGRGPLEAAGFGVTLRQGEVAFRCHLVTEHEGRVVDATAGGITTQEAAVLLEALNTRLGGEGVQFHVGNGHRHIMVVRDPAIAASCLTSRIPGPESMRHRLWERALPRTDGGPWLASLLRRARDILETHEVNQVRLDLQENPANFLWCWGQGQATSLPPLRELIGGSAGIVSGSHAVEGIARLAGVDVLVACGTFGADEDAYHDLARALLRGLKRHALVIAYVPLIEETRTAPRMRSRIAAIELFDRAFVGPLMGAPSTRQARWLVVPPCGPTTEAQAAAQPVPFLAAGPGLNPTATRFHESAAAHSPLQMTSGQALLQWWRLSSEQTEVSCAS